MNKRGFRGFIHGETVGRRHSAACLAARCLSPIRQGETVGLRHGETVGLICNKQSISLIGSCSTLALDEFRWICQLGEQRSAPRKARNHIVRAAQRGAETPDRNQPSPPIQPAPVLGRVQDASLRSRRSAVPSASLTRPARRRRSEIRRRDEEQAAPAPNKEQPKDSGKFGRGRLLAGESDGG